MSITAVNSTITVNRTVKRSGVTETSESETETLQVHQFATTPAVVSVSYPIKLCASYQSVGIEVGVALPCYAEEAAAGFDQANTLVVERLRLEIPKVKAILARLVEESKA